MARRVNSEMETLVGIVIRVRPIRFRGRLTGLVRRKKLLLFGIRDPAGSEATAHGFEFTHHLEHLDQLLRAHFGYNGAATRSQFDQPKRGKLDQRFAQGGTRDPEFRQQLCLVEALARRVLAHRDLFFDGFTELVGTFLLHDEYHFDRLRECYKDISD